MIFLADFISAAVILDLSRSFSVKVSLSYGRFGITNFLHIRGPVRNSFFFRKPLQVHSIINLSIPHPISVVGFTML